ncbi:MAG: hypothetical protein JXR81_01340 [Candidatus Goldbacteria bacterium]|nr:hypothetical protein [Candidatus Goldiibacteriota bacterium]
MRIIIYFILCFMAAIIPFVNFYSVKTNSNIPDFPGWPFEFEGVKLITEHMDDREVKYYTDFPGKSNRFTDGRRKIIIRWVYNQTRKLHPSSECFVGSGYKVKPMPLYKDKDGNIWGVFKASKKDSVFLVRERIYGINTSYSDVSAWYWAVLMKKTISPWWVITVAERVDK